jgi:hypothetical protein
MLTNTPELFPSDKNGGQIVRKRSGHLIGAIGPEELRIDFKRRSTQGQHADLGMNTQFLSL